MEEALALVHQWLAVAAERSTFTADEVSDILLDVQQTLVPPVPDFVPDDVLEPV